jgi:glycosyltransferase involved in cell wall biosynthesis
MTRLAVRSARSARLTVTPTAAMGGLLRSAAVKVTLRTIPFGFQPWAGVNGRPRPAPAPPPFRFLVVSHYNYFRNFETVFRAIAHLRDSGEPVELILSTQIQPGLRLGGYDTTRASQLIAKLGLSDAVTMVGPVPYDDLPSLYASAHAVLCPSYAESFGQTLLEAMAMGIPAIASDLPAHREVAGDAALFFPPLDPDALADRCRSLMAGASLREHLAATGRRRSQDFSWRCHFEELLAAAAEVARS